MTKEEFTRLNRVIDMTLTAHSCERDRYTRIYQLVDATLVISSAILLSLIFIDPLPQFLNLSANTAQGLQRFFAVFSFILSVLSWRMDWKQQAQRYAEDCDLLSEIKLQCRKVLSKPDENEDILKEVYQECSDKLAKIGKIKDTKFLKFKSKHYKKIEISKLIDKYPEVPLVFLRLLLFKRGFGKLRNGKTNKINDADGK